MIFRQLFDAESSTYTYLVADPATRRAALIDPVREQRDRDLLLVHDLEVTLAFALDTHVHADHVTALAALRRATGCETGVAACARTGATRQLAEGDVLSIPVKHTTGRYYVPEEQLPAVRVVLRYALDGNPNGSTNDIAGVSNPAGNVFGLMPHPEHAVDPLTGSDDGLRIFESMAGRVRELV